VPVKPLFFDTAWNYVEYPGRKTPAGVVAAVAGRGEVVDSGGAGGGGGSGEKKQEEKRGWFGFGRR